MADKVVQLFVRRFPGVGYSAQVLGLPHLASFGEKIGDVRADLSIVCGKLLARGELWDSPTHWPELKLRRVELVVRALQRGRLLSVPMRFSVLVRPEDPVEVAPAPKKKGASAGSGPVRVLVPRLELEEPLHDSADLDPFLEEIIRHELHLAPLERLLQLAYDGEESVETMTVSTRKAVGPRKKGPEPERKATRPPLPAGLSESCRRLNDEVEVGTLERAFQREAELGELTRAMTEATRTSVLLIGPPTVGKTALVHELVHRAASAPAGHPLRGLEVYSTSGGRIVAGMRYLGEWQDRVKRMVASLRTRRAVLHLDSLAELLQAGPGQEEGLDIARQLVASMEAGEISVICEATPEDAARAERTHSAFLQAMRRLVIQPLAPANARLALQSAAHRVGRARKVQFEEDALERAIDLVERFGEAGGIPGVAVDLLRASARQAPPPTSTVRAAKVTEAQVTRAFLDRTGYPREIVDPDVPLDPDAVLEKLEARVVGQREAVTLLRNLVVTLKTGMCDPSRPLGAYLLVGPTGVGKTESALSLCSYLFGDEKRLTRFDMAEYAAPGSAARLVGAFGAKGSLTAKVREQPFGVVLLDEIEKADAGVHDLLLQLLGEGRLTDGAGRTVSFRNTVVLLTSNLGADTLGRTLGFARGGAADVQAHYVGAASAFFRPELINRLDQIVPYRALSEEHLRAIATRALSAALEREGLTRRGVKVRFTPEVVERLAVLGFDVRYGARPLKRAIEQHAVAPLAQLLARAGGDAPKALELVVEDGRIVARPG